MLVLLANSCETSKKRLVSFDKYVFNFIYSRLYFFAFDRSFNVFTWTPHRIIWLWSWFKVIHVIFQKSILWDSSSCLSGFEHTFNFVVEDITVIATLFEILFQLLDFKLLQKKFYCFWYHVRLFLLVVHSNRFNKNK